jgi:eukaryotic-like serine/threonine-protein kinase
MVSSDAGVSARTIPLGPEDPAELGAYTLLGKLGQGGMGVVYLGRSEKGRLVAIKVIRADVADDAEFRARFRLETDTARRVARVCTAEVLDADPDAAQPYLVTEFIEGETLAKFVARGGPLADANLEQLAVGVAAALTAIHSAGIVHRDLKPANVILSQFGPRVIDFGIARALDAVSHLTGDLQQLGTPAFMSPEQIEGKAITPAVDIFAWGGLVTFAATGHYPFGDGDAQVLLYRALHEEARLDGVDPSLRPIVWHAMRKNPADRPTAQQLMLRLLGEPNTASTVDPQDVTQVLQDWKLPTPATPAGGGAAATLPPTRVRPGEVADDAEAPTRLPTGVGGRHAAARPTAAPVDVPGPVGPAPARRRNTPWIIGGAAAAVIAVLAAVLLVVNSGGKDKGGRGGAFALPKAAQSLGADTFVYVRNVAKSDGKYDLFTGRDPGSGTVTGERQITSGPGDNLLPAITKDRSTVIYTSQSATGVVLRAVAADGSGTPVTLFTSGPAAKLSIPRDSRASVSPDGNFVAVRSTTDQTGTPNPGIYIVSMDGTTVRRLKTKPKATDPAWSPDGETIAYWSSDSNANRGFIVVIPVTPGADAQPITSSKGPDLDADPTWSPDGKQIAFSRMINGDPAQLEIFVMNPDGSGQRRVTDHPGQNDQDPAYSPGNLNLLSWTGDVSRGRQIFVTNPNNPGGGERQVTNDPGFNGHIRWNAG